MKFKIGLALLLASIFFLFSVGGCRPIIAKIKSKQLESVLNHEAPLQKGETTVPILIANDPLLKWVKVSQGGSVTAFPQAFEIRTVGGCRKLTLPKKAETVFVNAMPPTTPKATGKVTVTWEGSTSSIKLCSPKGVRATLLIWYE